MSTFASSDKAKHWSNRNTIQPCDISRANNKKFWFDCPVCFHDFEKRLCHIAAGSWCPYCAHYTMCFESNCNFCHELSFASSDKAKYWSIKNTVTPREVFKANKIKYWFNCNVCKHDFEITLTNITSQKQWCPYCAHLKLCLDCDFCKEMSFASSDKAKYWSTKNTITPREVFNSSQSKYWFTCNTCNHDFDATLDNITHGFWCPYCASKKLCPISIDCDFCYNLSFASSYRAKYWSKKNTVKPREVFKSSASSNKYWFDCEMCKSDFETSLTSITHADSWCPNCKHKTEKMVFMFLKTIEDFEVKSHIKFNYENIRTFPFDLLVEYKDKKCIIEVDGGQHFITEKEHYASVVSNQERTERDILKMKAVIQDYSIIRLVQIDIFKNKYNWKQFILDTMHIAEAGKVYINRLNSDMYDSHLIDFEYEILPKV